MSAATIWHGFLWAAFWLVVFAGFWGWLTHRTRGAANWGTDVTHTPAEAEKIWLDLVERRKKRGAA